MQQVTGNLDDTMWPQPQPRNCGASLEGHGGPRLTETGWSFPRASTLATVMKNCAVAWRS